MRTAKLVSNASAFWVLALGSVPLILVSVFVFIKLRLFYQEDWKTVSVKARNVPIVPPWVLRDSVRIDSVDALWLGQLLRPTSSEKTDVSMMLHLIRLHGKDASIEGVYGLHSNSMLDILTNELDGRRILGNSPMILTDFGVRYISVRPSDRLLTFSKSGESHRDQFLATMAELNVSLEHSIIMEEGTFSLRSVLSDSLAQFHLDQEELEWSAFAYAAYLPPLDHWSNRFGEEYSFDDVARKLLDRPLSASTCNGTHVVFALTAMLYVDSIHTILSPTIREDVDERLNEWLYAVIENQLSDGSWTSKWWERLPSAERHVANLGLSANARLLPTSHIVEWLFILPKRFEVPSITTREATRFLINCLKNASDEQLWRDFCPYSHASHVLRLSNGVPKVAYRRRKPTDDED